METWTGFVLAVLGLLLTPGPTNSLMAASGAQRGVVASLPLLAGEVAGYLIAITLWMELVGAAAAANPTVLMVAKLVAAGFLLWSASKLWRHAGASGGPGRGISVGRVFSTTLLNPKGLVFAFAIFPHLPLAARLPHLGVFTGLVLATATGWIGIGALAARGARGVLTEAMIERITAVALAAFASVLVVQTLGH